MMREETNKSKTASARSIPKKVVQHQTKGTVYVCVCVVYRPGSVPSDGVRQLCKGLDRAVHANSGQSADVHSDVGHSFTQIGTIPTIQRCPLSHLRPINMRMNERLFGGEGGEGKI